MEYTFWHSLSVEDTLSKLHSSFDGITHADSISRLKRYGPNELKNKKGPNLLIIFLRQFLNPLIYILVAAALVKHFIGAFFDASVILGTIGFMVIIAFIQEAKAEKAMQALKDLSTPRAKIKRNGKVQMISSKEIVPGDILILEAGDKVSADARLIETINCKSNESALTGESEPVEKTTEITPETSSIAEQINMVFAGTTISFGKALAVVCHTGMQTQIGKIATALQDISKEKTPLQKSIQSLGNWMLLAIAVAIAIFVGVGIQSGMKWIDIFLLSVSAAVAAVPEGLPAVVTVVLASGVHLMSKKNAIIRKLIAVETLGSTTLICSDKTGTITLNQMTVTKIFTMNHFVNIEGEKNSTQGEFYIDGTKINPTENSDLLMTLTIGALCNDASISDKNEMIGDATEGGIIFAAAKAGLSKSSLELEQPRKKEIPFQSQKQFMATLNPIHTKNRVCMKGSPEKILSFCTHVLIDGNLHPLDEKRKEQIRQALELMAKEALRVIAVGYHENIDPTHFDECTICKNLIFVGMFGMIDPPHKEVVKAIAQCREAGIKVVMATGDNKITAKAIADQIGLDPGVVLTGHDIETMSDEKLQAIALETSVFARIEPLHKLKVINAYKASGHVVAMTGDGVNDAPALETSDIGISMGITGTDVAKESSDMILMDDNFATIVDAVEEGRAIFNRLRNAISFLLTTCFGELSILISCVFFLKVSPLIPMQILWINLITGGIIAIPLGLEPKVGDELKYPPRNPKVNLIFPGMVLRSVFLSCMMGLGGFYMFDWSLHKTNIQEARTMVFCSIIVFEWLIAFNKRSDELTVFKMGFFKNKYLIISIALAASLLLAILYIPVLSIPFQTVPLSWKQWIIISIPGVIIFAFETLRKMFFPKLFSYGKWQPNKTI